MTEYIVLVGTDTSGDMYGPFDSHRDADDWITTNYFDFHSDPHIWELIAPIDFGA